MKTTIRKMFLAIFAACTFVMLMMLHVSVTIGDTEPDIINITKTDLCIENINVSFGIQTALADPSRSDLEECAAVCGGGGGGGGGGTTCYSSYQGCWFNCWRIFPCATGGECAESRVRAKDYESPCSG